MNIELVLQCTTTKGETNSAQFAKFSKKKTRSGKASFLAATVSDSHPKEEQL